MSTSPMPMNLYCYTHCIVKLILLVLSMNLVGSLSAVAESTARAAESPMFSGQVLDSESNQPVVNATITLFGPDSASLDSHKFDSNSLRSARSATTNRQGHFAFEAPGLFETVTVEHPEYMFFESTLENQAATNEQAFELRKRIPSAASKRWDGYIENDSPAFSFEAKPGWSVKFEQHELKGDFAPDHTITRRDPSAVLKIGGLYYVWYSRGTGEVFGFDTGDLDAKVFPWDYCDIYYATSKDGITWEERGPAVLRGKTGAFDDRSVFTPEVLAHDGKYYLVYQAVKSPYVERVKNTVAMAWADSPHGPWNKLDKPILKATNNGIWQPDSTSNHDADKKGDFDSHKVHDPTLFYFNDKFYLYYKGERMGEERYFGQREIKWGVAIADDITGPYTKSPYNPITNTGHELVIWQYDDGIALINTLDGPERGTVQFAKDGLNFEVMGEAKALPHAQGLYRSQEDTKDPLHGINWGLSHVLVWGGPTGWGWMYINRFEAKRTW